MDLQTIEVEYLLKGVSAGELRINTVRHILGYGESPHSGHNAVESYKLAHNAGHPSVGVVLSEV